MPARIIHPGLPSNKDHTAYMRAWRAVTGKKYPDNRTKTMKKQPERIGSKNFQRTCGVKEHRSQRPAKLEKHEILERAPETPDYLKELERKLDEIHQRYQTK